MWRSGILKSPYYPSCCSYVGPVSLVIYSFNFPDSWLSCPPFSCHPSTITLTPTPIQLHLNSITAVCPPVSCFWSWFLYAQWHWHCFSACSYCLFCYSSTFHIRIWEGSAEGLPRWTVWRTSGVISWPQHGACFPLPSSEITRISALHPQLSLLSEKTNYSVNLKSQNLEFLYCRSKCIFLKGLDLDWSSGGKSVVLPHFEFEK